MVSETTGTVALTLCPPETSLWREARAVGELLRFGDHKEALRHAPRGNARVLVAPGFMTADAMTWPLRRALHALGHQAYGWAIGRNTGDVRSLLPRLLERVKHLAAQQGPLHLVGWSLGGLLCREVARELPDHVLQVVTLGTPLVGGFRYTAAVHYGGSWWGRYLEPVDQRRAPKERPLRVPVVALYTPDDGIVSAAACIDRVNAHVRHVAVRCGHAGLGFSPEVFSIIARCVAG